MKYIRKLIFSFLFGFLLAKGLVEVEEVAYNIRKRSLHEEEFFSGVFAKIWDIQS